MSTKAAPDVDLRERGLPQHVVVAAVAILSALFIVGRGAKKSGEDGLEQEETSRVLSWVIWLIVRLVQMVFGLAVLLLSVLVVQQRKIIYVPAPPGTPRSTKDNHSSFRSPKFWGLPYEDLMVTTEDGTRVNAWLIYQEASAIRDGKVPFTFVYFHGNAGNIGHRLENIRDMHKKLKVNVLIVDYRGYGDSEDGDGPSEKGFLMDAHGVYRWLVERIRNPTENDPTRMSEDRILLFGRSIGGAVAARLMADILRDHLDPPLANSKGDSLPIPGGLILENTFTSLRDMALQLFPFLSFVKFLLRSPLVRDEWKSAESLDFIVKNHSHWSCCLLSGLQDQIVPPAQMNQIYSILREKRPKVLKFFRFPTGGHNDTPHKGGEDYWNSFQKFMDLADELVDKERPAAEAE